ncbi:hypothetical protein PR202_ga19948 [Eleusine coracana subsp. coracana]|uniref:NAC domain-containing protein n=1 Tax=Eleusine coracana subsp. coracana TaxID=191504 RepID=A0AAV5CWY4_ELECO|nr:hypothetical protein PR202_ga19948 [Eleusine coracana subsp. coracana]
MACGFDSRPRNASFLQCVEVQEESSAGSNLGKGFRAVQEVSYAGRKQRRGSVPRDQIGLGCAPLADDPAYLILGSVDLYWLRLRSIKTDGSSRHFFHRISNAYGSGPRKRRKIDNKEHTACDDKNVRWHKTGRSKEVFDENGAKRGWKKILVLYTGSKKGGGKTDKAGWVMHQYHLGADEAEKDGQLVVCKIFYQSASKQIGKFEMDVSVMEHDASAVRIDPRTPKTDPPQPHLPSNSPCETEQYTSPFLLDQGEAESSRSNFCIKDEYEYRAWHPGLSQILEETAQPDEPSVTATQTFGSESGSGSGVQTFLDKAKATVSSTQVLKPGAGPNSRLGRRSWESGVQDMQSGSQEDLEAMLAQFYSTDADGNYN